MIVGVESEPRLPPNKDEGRIQRSSLRSLDRLTSLETPRANPCLRLSSSFEIEPNCLLLYLEGQEWMRPAVIISATLRYPYSLLLTLLHVIVACVSADHVQWMLRRDCGVPSSLSPTTHHYTFHGDNQVPRPLKPKTRVYSQCNLHHEAASLLPIKSSRLLG